MIVDVVRAVTDWLADEATGVNALAAAVPRDDGDPAPGAVQVLDETRSAWVARGLIDRVALKAGPALLVHAHGPLEQAGQVEDAAGGDPVTLILRYAALGTLTDEMVRDGLQLLRTAKRVIAGRYEGPLDVEVRNSVTIYPPVSLTILPDFQEQTDGALIGALVVQLRADDPWSHGISTSP